MCENPLHGRMLRAIPLLYKELPEKLQKRYTAVHWWSPSLHTYDMPLPCGYCLECRLDKAKQFAIKCSAEAKCHSENCFVTLSYNDKHLPHTKNGLNTVRYDDVCKFFKRLLKKYPECKIRRFYSSEYGYKGTRASNGGNPHYHALIFGWKPKDLVFYKKNKETGDIQYKSKELMEIWGKGFVVIGDVTVESAGYTCRYTMKKAGIRPPKKIRYPNPEYNPWYDEKSKVNKGKNKYIYEQEPTKIKVLKNGKYVEIIDDREKERIRSSNRPGIGHPYWEANMDKIKLHEGFYIKTKKGVRLMPIPKTWREKWKKSNDWENYWKYWFKKIKEFENMKNEELKQHPGFTWEELQKQKNERLRQRILALKRNEDFYCQEY